VHLDVESVLRNQPTMEALPDGRLLLIVHAFLWYEAAATPPSLTAMLHLKPTAPGLWCKFKRPQAIAEVGKGGQGGLGAGTRGGRCEGRACPGMGGGGASCRALHQSNDPPFAAPLPARSRRSWALMASLRMAAAPSSSTRRPWTQHWQQHRPAWCAPSPLPLVPALPAHARPGADN